MFRHLTVEKNIMAILETRAELTVDQRAHLLEELLHDLHIAERRDTLGISLSGGERRRVEIARASRPRRASFCSTSRSPASTRFRSSRFRTLSSTCKNAVSACSLPTITCGKPSKSAIAPIL